MRSDARRGLMAAGDGRRTASVFMQNFFELFEQCQSAASILLDASRVGGLSGSVHLRDGERGMAVRLDAFGTGALCASLSISLALLTATGAAAQSPSSQPKPVTGFVSTYEVMRTVRAAGFDPLVPPLREGTTYVLRATDFRGILMRVVLDARTGSIRDVTRIVPASPAPMGTMPPSYGAAPGYGPPPSYSSVPYGSPVELGAPTGMGPGGAPESQPALPAASTPARPQSPPPRAKPTEQASQKPGSTGSSAGVAPATDAASTTNVGTNTRASAGTKPETTATVPTTAATAPPIAPAPAGKTPPVPPIND